MRVQKIISFLVYFIAAITLGSVAYVSMMAGVWGVAISPLNYLAVLAGLLLFCGSFVCFADVSKGRIVCGISLGAMGLFYVPAFASIVPAHNESISPVAYLIFLDYFGALAFTLFYPTRVKFALRVFFAMVAIGLVFFGVIFTRRVAAGEYNRPSFAFFVWQPSGTNLQMENESHGWMTVEAKSLLEKNGVRGKIKWVGSRGLETQKNRIIILTRCQIPVSKQIAYPRNGTLVYAFDGTNWLTFPHDVPIYPTSATLNPEGFNTMLNEKCADGGIEGTGAFFWK